MILGRLYAQLCRLMDLNTIRVVAAVVRMMYDAEHPSFGDERFAIPLTDATDMELAAIELTSVQADIIALYCVGYFTGEFKEIRDNYPDYLVAVHTIGEWVGWEAAIRDITGYGVGRYAEIRAHIWGDAVPFGSASGSVQAGYGHVVSTSRFPEIRALENGTTSTLTLVKDQPEYASVPELLEFAVAALNSARISVEKVIASPDRPIKSVGSFTRLIDLIADLSDQAAAARHR